MIVIRCTAKLLKRLRQPAKPPDPPPSDNPLGEWYADIDSIDREPFVVLLNAATGAGLVLPGRAANLRELHNLASEQLFKLLMYYGFDLERSGAGAELLAWREPPTYARTLDRSLVQSLVHAKQFAWDHFAYVNRSLPDAALGQWDRLFSHPSLPRHPRMRSHTDLPASLVRARLQPAAEVIELATWRARMH